LVAVANAAINAVLGVFAYLPVRHDVRRDLLVALNAGFSLGCSDKEDHQQKVNYDMLHGFLMLSWL
jgi:hypothetical protein